MLNIKKLHYSISEGQFHVLCYAACVFLLAVGHTKIQNLSLITGIMTTYGKFLPAIFSLLFLFRKLKFDTRSLLFIILFGILLLQGFLYRDLSYTIFFIAFFMISCSRSKEVNIYKYYTIAIFSVILLTLFLTALGILENDNSWYGRDDLGFTYTTFGPNLFLSACISLVCWKKEKINWKEWVFILLLNQFFFWKTSTDAVYLCVILLFIFVMAMKFSGFQCLVEENKAVRFILSHSALIFAVFTIGFQLFYNSRFNSASMVWLNNVLSTRLYMGRRVFLNYGTGSFTKELLFGMGTELATYLDSSYLSILTEFGIPMLIVFCFVMDYIAQKSYKKYDLYLVICIFVFMVHCITDPQLSSFRCNPIIITTLIYFRKNKKELIFTRGKTSIVKYTGEI